MRILIVDDHILFREGLVSLLKIQPDMQVVGEVGTVQDAIDLSINLRPDVILMDFSLPDGTGLDATRAILSSLPHTKILFLTIHDDDERLFTAIRAGAKGYLLKNLSINNLLTSLRAAEKDEAVISRSMMAKILKEFANPKGNNQNDPGNALSNLTARELEILSELSTGATNSMIAQRLFISENTVKNHIHNILDKLDVPSRREAIRFAFRNGLTKNNGGAYLDQS